jgi:hypothetical protein
MSFWVTFDKGILDAAQFVRFWNAEPQCVGLARAELKKEAPQGSSLDPKLTAFLSGAGSSLAASYIFDKVKLLLAREKPDIEIEYLETVCRDGTSRIFIKRAFEKKSS